MKKRFVYIALMLVITLTLSGCFPYRLITPSNQSMGAPLVFEKDGIRLTLTDNFIEKESELGYYGYYVSNYCGVVVTKEAFTLEEGMEELSVEDYIRRVIANNGHTEITPQAKDGLCFYVRDSESTRGYIFAFKGSDAFWLVQYMCVPGDVSRLEGQFFQWASCVEVA